MTTRLRKWLLASPPAEWAVNQLRELLIGGLRQGPIPRHVAFVMDGNRRYAKSHRIESVEGHHLGFEALARILEVCYKAGVTHVTIYAFSIENFKRSRYEVDALMEMAKVKLIQLSQHGDLMDRYGASIRVLGHRELVNPDVLDAIDTAVKMTSGNRRCVLNVCFPYTSRDEMTTAIRRTVEEWNEPGLEGKGAAPFETEQMARDTTGHDKGPRHNLRPGPSPEHAIASPSSSFTSLSSNDDNNSSSSNHQLLSSFSSTTTLQQPASPIFELKDTKECLKDEQPIQQQSPTATDSLHHHVRISPLHSPETITSSTLTSHMFTWDNPPLDLLIRTSAVHRLSDFMLWQCHQRTEIAFLDVLWPEFDLSTFLPVLWEWQWRQRKKRTNAAAAAIRDIDP